MHDMCAIQDTINCVNILFYNTTNEIFVKLFQFVEVSNCFDSILYSILYLQSLMIVHLHKA